MKKLTVLLLVLAAALSLLVYSCKQDKTRQPRLVVGIVIDQMRFDYLYRYYDHYSDRGFKRLLKQGMNFSYAQYNYVPTYTGPGHSSIYAGSVPYYTGISSNDWYDRKLRKTIYCVSDKNYKTVGADNESGMVSPNNLKVTTLGDELRMSNNGHSKVFAVSIKDRAAVLPGGHMANAAYWFDGKSGCFVTSSYYMKALPDWVNRFNSQQPGKKMMAGEWTLSLPMEDYMVAMPDSGAGESDVFREGKTTFPHSFAKIPETEKQEFLKSTPYGNELLTDFVISLLENEKAGEGKFTDLLAISYSSSDYVGHAYGPNSIEVMDTYIKLDHELARLLDALDKAVGKGNYLLFLTADHAVKPNLAYLQENKVPAGSLSTAVVQDSLAKFTRRLTGIKGIIDTLEGNQLYFNLPLLQHKNIDLHLLYSRLVPYLRENFPQIADIYTHEDLEGKIPVRSMANFVLNGYYEARSGDLVFELAPNYLTEIGSHGTTHGASYDYDSHVPLIFYGWHVEHGESNREVYVEDIAPTVASLIRVQEPNGTIGIPILPAK